MEVREVRRRMPAGDMFMTHTAGADRTMQGETGRVAATRDGAGTHRPRLDGLRKFAVAAHGLGRASAGSAPVAYGTDPGTLVMRPAVAMWNLGPCDRLRTGILGRLGPLLRTLG